MARITVEDCLQQIGNENRFALIHLAVERVKQHRSGAQFPERCKNKEIVCALREIAGGTVNFDNIRQLRQQVVSQAAAAESPAGAGQAPAVVAEPPASEQ